MEKLTLMELFDKLRDLAWDGSCFYFLTLKEAEKQFDECPSDSNLEMLKILNELENRKIYLF